MFHVRHDNFHHVVDMFIDMKVAKVMWQKLRESWRDEIRGKNYSAKKFNLKITTKITPLLTTLTNGNQRSLILRTCAYRSNTPHHRIDQLYISCTRIQNIHQKLRAL
jgi:hypothetical protein